MNALVEQMIGLVGELPIEWQPRWNEMGGTNSPVSSGMFREP